MRPLPSRSAFTLAEILVTVAIIGVITAAALPVFGNMEQSAKIAQSTDHMESLNRAVKSYSQNCSAMSVPANNGATTDEFLVLRSLQFKWPSSYLKIGSPFFINTYDPVASSNATTYRMRWNGSSFELLQPGTVGTGILKPFDGSDLKKVAVAFTSGFKPVGMN